MTHRPKSIIIFILLLLVATISVLLYQNKTATAEKNVCFSPEQNCDMWLISKLKKAKKSIYAAVYLITSRRIAEELVRLKRSNINIKLILDKKEAKNLYSKYNYLKNRGIDVRLLSKRFLFRRKLIDGKMHNKFVIIDKKGVITGSFNWTASAAKYNMENQVYIDDPSIVKAYLSEFSRLWDMSH